MKGLIKKVYTDFMEEISESDMAQTSLFNSATAAKLVLVGLALATGIAIGVGTTSLYYQNNISNAALTPTPVASTITPTPTLRITSIPTMQAIDPTMTFDQKIMNKDGIITCTTDADCTKECDQKTIDMYGNNSHCPIAQCIKGQCRWKLVP